eukprot:TRINITY_DN25760_c0_g2_i1.p1 TRINITY_DN25760_c0_g2~~TRINITY_DN25760_c0_g2_i1.p1  ORF type:complete len:753 (+),score=161.58 TRINITY_DN25760_c0_g2_i1:32-2290(+)
MALVEGGARERSVSPTVTLYQNRRHALENMARMANMGLHVLHPDWQAATEGMAPRGRMFSTSFKNTRMKIAGTNEELTIPVQTCTKVSDMREALARALMVNADDVNFYQKAGCTTRKQMHSEEIGSVVTVKGIETFKPQKHQWEHPTGIIGCGYNGIKTAMLYAKYGDNNFVAFDRNDKVGGYCWITAANEYSKLQTELGSFHVWWGQDFVTDKTPYPTKDWGIWPQKKDVLRHFHHAAESYGVLPNMHLNSNVAKLDIIGGKDDQDRYYKLSVVPAKMEGTIMKEDDDAEPKEYNVSCLYNYPGCMTRNRIIEYPGEDVFGGLIAYGMNDDCPYSELQGKNIAILGNGAFAVENARTAVEHGANKVFLLTRRKNLASPRVPCWFVHQGPVPTPGKLVLDMFQPMYELAGFGDPWEYWSVHANAERTKVNIIQNSRFGIGDVTFIMVIYGKLEYVEDTLKRLSPQTMHLTGGEKIEDVYVILKSLGLLGDFAVDRLHKMKQMVGLFCDGDWRRPLMIDAIGMNAANFTTFSTGIGTTGFVRGMKYLQDNPKEFYRVRDMGVLKQLPTNKADENLDKPAYVFDVKYTMSASIILESMVPKMGELSVIDPEYKHRMYHTSHPIDYFLEECIKDWDKYQTLFKEQGCDHEYVPYPYTKEMISKYFEEYSQLTGVQISIEGPAKDAPEIKVPKPVDMGDLPVWANDENNLNGFNQQVLKDKKWWKENFPKQNNFQRADHSGLKNMDEELRDAPALK